MEIDAGNLLSGFSSWGGEVGLYAVGEPVLLYPLCYLFPARRTTIPNVGWSALSRINNTISLIPVTVGCIPAACQSRDRSLRPDAMKRCSGSSTSSSPSVSHVDGWALDLCIMYTEEWMEIRGWRTVAICLSCQSGLIVTSWSLHFQPLSVHLRGCPLVVFFFEETSANMRFLIKGLLYFMTGFNPQTHCKMCKWRRSYLTQAIQIGMYLKFLILGMEDRL